MEILREVNGFKLNKGNLMANGLFNVSNDTDVSFWLDNYDKDTLMSLNDTDFVKACINYINDSINVD